MFLATLVACEWQGNYRVSRDGSKIAIPTKEQLAFQDREIGVLIHFNIATYISDDGCNYDPSLVPERSLFDPQLLNTDQWMDTIKELGGHYATLVAKHNCGFTLWPSKVHFATRDGTNMKYNYTVTESPEHADVVSKFVKSADNYGIGHGFYYSSVVNNYLNVQKGKVRDDLAKDQIPISNQTYDQVVLAQLNELWKKYGKLTEVSGRFLTATPYIANHRRFGLMEAIRARRREVSRSYSKRHSRKQLFSMAAKKMALVCRKTQVCTFCPKRTTFLQDSAMGWNGGGQSARRKLVDVSSLCPVR